MPLSDTLNGNPTIIASTQCHPHRRCLAPSVRVPNNPVSAKSPLHSTEVEMPIQSHNQHLQKGILIVIPKLPGSSSHPQDKTLVKGTYLWLLFDSVNIKTLEFIVPENANTSPALCNTASISPPQGEMAGTNGNCFLSQTVKASSTPLPSKVLFHK